MVSGVLHHLGVFTGDLSNGPVYEDRRLAAAVNTGRERDVSRIVREYNNRFPVWAYKRPALLDNFQIIHNSVRNPVYLFIFKDIFSIANRNSISMKADLVSGLRGAVERYSRVVKFIEDRNPNGLLLSYDRIMQNPDSLVSEANSLIGGVATQEQLQAARAFIDPHPAEYLDASRVTKSFGRVRLEEGLIIGQVRYERPIQTDISVNIGHEGKILAQIQAKPGPAKKWSHFRVPRSSLPESGVLQFQASEDVRPFARINL